jgi:hypothetical protein
MSAGDTIAALDALAGMKLQQEMVQLHPRRKAMC